MATIEIFAWKEHFVEGNAVYDHANAEFRKHLRRGMKASPAEIRRLARQVVLRQPLCLGNVHDEAVYGLTQILQAMGRRFASCWKMETARAYFDVPQNEDVGDEKA